MTTPAPFVTTHADGRSLGTGDELFTWIDRHAPALRAEDLLATAAEAVGTAIGHALRTHGVHDAVIAGGGARHPRLRAAIERAAGCRTLPSDALGVPVGDRETVEWAVLGALAADHVDIALPAVTRRQSGSVPVSGSWIRSSHNRITALNPT